jgi:hypothetical protein
MLERNIGGRDRTFRLLISAVLLCAGVVLLALRAELIALAPAAVGLVALITALTRRSPLYAALRMSTLGLTRVSSASV